MEGNLLCIWRAACLARDVLDNVSAKNVLDLLLLETTLDDQSAFTSHGTAGTQLSEQELCDVLFCTFHPLANLGDVGKDGLLVAFTETLRWRNLIAPGTGVGEVGMLRVELREEPVEEVGIRDGCSAVVGPDAGALDHVALLYLRLSSSGRLLLALRLLASSSGQLGFEVVLDLLLAGLLLLLERGEVVFSGVLLALFLLL